MAEKSTNVVWQEQIISRKKRESLNNHKGSILWFTGLSGAGKSTLATAVEVALHERGIRTIVLDGDNIRHGLCSDLGFSDDDRKENIRRIGEAAKLFMQAGVIVITAFISPFRSDRQTARGLVDEADFNEIYCECPLDVCESRDVKGLYKKARAGEIKHFTGISSPYEEPYNAQVTVNTSELEIKECVQSVMDFMEKSGVIPKV